MFITTEDYKFRDLLQNKMAKDMTCNRLQLYRKYTSFNNQEGASWTYDTPSVIDKIFSKTNHMQISFCFPAAYTQLETPSEVAIAVRMLIAI